MQFVDFGWQPWNAADAFFFFWFYLFIYLNRRISNFEYKKAISQFLNFLLSSTLIWILDSGFKILDSSLLSNLLNSTAKSSVWSYGYLMDEFGPLDPMESAETVAMDEDEAAILLADDVGLNVITHKKPNKVKPKPNSPPSPVPHGPQPSP